MKSFLIFSIFISGLYAFCSPVPVFAQTTPVSSSNSSVQTINARILPTIWYSTLSAQQGDSVNIYAAIQNNSGTDFTGTADFYLDDVKISGVPFSSPTGGLEDIHTSWAATSGKHSVFVKISTSLPSDISLVSYQSDKSNISIQNKITAQSVEAAAFNAANTIVSSVDNAANSMADRIDSFKKPIGIDINAVVAGNTKNNFTEKDVSAKPQGKVLSALTESSDVVPGNDTINVVASSAFNLALSGLAFLLRNWEWTLGGILLLFLLLKIMR